MDVAIAQLITFILIIVVTLLVAIIGGKTGERYYRKIDHAGMV